MTDDYILGTHDEELDRLGLQHQVWHPETTRLWAQAGFGPGQTILDAGCGPGFATVDLAGLVGAAGRVTGVDQDEGFVATTRARVAALGLTHVTAHVADIDAALPDPGPFDGVFLRWVLSFLPRPDRAIANLARALKPGAALLAMDYAHYRAARVFPAQPVLEQLFIEFDRANAGAGGSFDHGSGMAAWAIECGLSVSLLDPIVHAARPGGRHWYWFSEFCRVFVPSMVDRGQVDAAFANDVTQALRTTEQTPGAFFLTPPVLTMIARRPM